MLAFHSHHVLPIAWAYEQALDQNMTHIKETSEPGSVPVQIFSSVTGELLTAEECSPSYWKRNLTSVSYSAFREQARGRKVGQHAANKIHHRRFDLLQRSMLAWNQT